MFDKIHFIEHKNSVLTEHNLVKSIHTNDPIQQKVSEELAFKQTNYRFNIDGHTRLLLPDPFSSNDLNRYLIPQLFCHFECGPNYYTIREDYESYEIVFTYEGSGYLEYMGKTFHLGPGDGFFIDCRKPHIYRTEGEKWNHSVLHFDGLNAALLYEEFESYGSVIFHDSFEGNYQIYLESLLNIWDHFQLYKDLQISNMISEIVTYLLLIKGMEHKSQAMPESIYYITKYIQYSFSSHITLDFLAEFSNMSKYYLTREFKKHVGTSPIQYLIQTRILNAKFMLLHTSKPISSIAEETGFTDINNFNRLFLKNVGVTPNQFRHQNRQIMV